MAALTIAVCSSFGPSARAQQEPGRIAGRVRLVASVGRKAALAAAYPSRTISTHAAHDRPEARNVVVYVKGAKAVGELPVARAEMRQQNEDFVPHVLAITKGSTVNFPNGDPFFHNVFSLSGASTFDLGRFPQHHSRARVFQKPGIVKVYCQIHSHMSAVILVLETPHFAVPDDEGAFAIENVPVGHYSLAAWHERVGENTASVHIEPSKTTSVEFALPALDK